MDLEKTMNKFEQLKKAFFNHIQSLHSVDQSALTHVSFELNTDLDKIQFGDISTNIAMILAKQLKSNPRKIAESITQSFSHKHVEKAEIAGPGFINLFATDKFYTDLTEELHAQKENFFKPEEKPTKNLNVEFVSANPTGPLHFGHGRNAIIGDVLARVLKFLEYPVTKEFYINDAGAQITKLGKSLKVRCQQELGEVISLPEDAYQGEYLIETAQKCIAEHGKGILEESDRFFEEYGKKLMLEQLKTTLQSFNINFDIWFSEKSLHGEQKIEEALAILEKNNYLYEADGALWFKSTEFGDDKDRVLKKKDGSYTYVSGDIAYMLNKLNRGFDQLVMVLGHDHHSYEFRLKALLQALGYKKEQLNIILYQLVHIKNKDGQSARMSKRSGNIVTLHDIIESVGCDVARFFFLNRKADAELDFDLDLALKQSNENPVYYIQYAYVRTHSLLQKAQSEHNVAPSNNTPKAFTKYEKLLIKKIVSFKELLSKIGNNHQIHLISYFTYEVANLFNTHYNSAKMIDAQNLEQTQERLFMVKITQQTIQMCLNLLGISTPTKM